MDRCIYDSYVQCFRDCQNCPRKIKGEPDSDDTRELKRDEGYDFED